jgi:carbonic anhydrase
MTDDLERLLANNRAWAASMAGEDESFFSSRAGGQAPHYLWIGCSDSRVPSTQIVGLKPGDVFVHRNVANLVAPDDLSCLSVVEFAVSVLKVRHVIVCGHDGCGGVQAALDGLEQGRVGRWVKPIRELKERARDQLTGLERGAALKRLCELNVLRQLRNLCDTEPVRKAWSEGQDLTIHGWIYGLGDGLLRDLAVSVDKGTDLADVASP